MQNGAPTPFCIESRYSSTGNKFLLCLSGTSVCFEEFPSLPEAKGFDRSQNKEILLTLKELRCLKDKRWLNDSVVDSYLRFLYNSTMTPVGVASSFLLKKIRRDGPKSIEEWKDIPTAEDPIFEKYLIPCSISLHWLLIVFYPLYNKIEILDSFNRRHSKLAAFVSQFFETRGFEEISVSYPNVPSQLNSYDCGVFILQFAYCLFYGLDFDTFDQEDMPIIRKRVYNELKPHTKP